MVSARLTNGRDKAFNGRDLRVAQAGQCCWRSAAQAISAQKAFGALVADDESACVRGFQHYNQVQMRWTLSDIVSVYYVHPSERPRALRMLGVLRALGKNGTQLVRFQDAPPAQTEHEDGANTSATTSHVGGGTYRADGLRSSCKHELDAAERMR